MSVAQVVQVPSGGEVMLFGNTDVSASVGLRCVSARGTTPGFVSLFNQAQLFNYSDQAHVNGYVKKYGNTPFVFPIGNGMELRTLEISKPDLITDAYATAWIEGDPGTIADLTIPNTGYHPVGAVQDPIQLVSNTGQWDWLVGASGNLGVQTTGNGAGIRVTVSTPNLTQFADKSELRLVGWNGTRWIDLSGRPSATGNRKNSKLSGNMVPGITAIAIGRIRPVPLAANRQTILKELPALILFPNPVQHQGSIQVRIPGKYWGQANLNLYDASGRNIRSVKINCKPGINIATVVVTDLVSGTYFVDLRDPSGELLTTSAQFVKIQ